ncbi:septum formation initiator family protein [Candidatus Shapirobacteria bacterium]|nr:septum formation initiator family protein [Candidatus Shapirobacteria bacterium]
MRSPVNILQNRLSQILIVLVGIGLIVSLSRNIFKLLKAADELNLAEQKVKQLEQESADLAQKKEFYQSEAFIEQEARNKLNMTKEGETVVILPPNLKQVLGEKENLPTEPLPNWRQWWNLFF